VIADVQTQPVPSEIGSLQAWLRAVEGCFRKLIDGDALR